MTASYELTEVRRPIGPMPAASLVAPDPSDDLLSAFVPLPVRRRQSTAGTEWMQEIRRVTVVMASLSVAGSADGGVELAHLGVQAFQRVMARFEGAAKVLVDNKGVTLSGAFGLPPRAHADDARRAITAAETLRRELEDIGLSCTVGVATGRAFCGIFGSDLRREYTLHGEVVNLASRLMEASGGEILCCDATAQAAHESVVFEALEPVMLKGRAEPVAVHRASWTRSADSARESRMVGREAEQAAIRARIDDLVTEDRSATVVIEGGAGLGKSLLVAEAIRLARARGVRVLTRRGRCGRERHELLRLALDVHRPARGHRADDGRSALPRGAVRPGAAADAPAAQQHRPGRHPRQRADRGDGRQRARGEHQAAAGLDPAPHDGARRRSLVVVEDAHWLDSNSWALLLEIVQSVPRALVAVDHAPDGRPARAVRAAAGAGVDRGPRPAAARAPARSRRSSSTSSASTTLPLELTGFVDDRVAGHPFFCEQLVQTMREGGAGPGAGRRPPWSGTSTPSTSRPPSRAPSSAASTASRAASCCA